MKKQLLQKLVACLSGLLLTQTILAQDQWNNVEAHGIDDYYNSTLSGLHVFGGHIYAGSGTYQGYIYRSSSGHPGTWNPVYSTPYVSGIYEISSTNAGTGMIYAAGDGGCCDSSRVLASADGITWSTYFAAPSGESSVRQIVPFKGLGTVDSIYLIDGYSSGSRIFKSHYNSNDPNNLSGNWDTVFQFALSSLPGANVQCATVHNGKMYIGTNYGATLWSSADGMNWVQNDSVGNGFGDIFNGAITSLASFGGYLYVGTDNNNTGPQIWRSNDDLNWTMVAQYTSGDSRYISCLEPAAGKLWGVVAAQMGERAIVVKTSDGVTFNVSSVGFGEDGINGNRATMAQFGNNIYFGGENYFFGGAITGGDHEARQIGANGGQIWRLCTTTPPVVNIGADQTVCPGVPVPLNAGAGAIMYQWSNGDTTQTTSATTQGLTYLNIIGSNGCTAGDSVMVFYNAAPGVTPPNIPPAVCSGNPFVLDPQATSNVYIADSPIHYTNNDFIADYAAPVQDSVVISGAPGSIAGASLMSVTIDSMYHSYVGDVAIGIYAPDGSYVDLSSSHGGSANDAYWGTTFIMNATQNINSASPPFIGSYLPDNPFSGLTGSPNGTWVLKIQDFAGGDEGYLKGWTIRFKVDDTVMTYSWSPALGLSSTNTLTTISTAAATTTYTLSITNSIGCTSQTPLTVNVPTIGLAQSADTMCYMSVLPISLSGGSSNTIWTPSTGLDVSMGQYVNASPATSTHYYLTDTLYGCPLYDSIFVYANGQMFNTAPTPASICYADTASLTSNASGGSGPYSYSWDMGGVYFYGQTINEPFTTPTSFTITATDAAGCTAIDYTNVSVSPSTDIYGQVTYSGGPVASSNIVIYRYEPYLTHFDTVQTTTTDLSGNYHFVAINHFDYLIEVFPNASYTTLVPSYYGDVFLWDSATVVNHDCSSDDTLNIVAVEEAVLGGPGALGGIILEGDGFNRVPGEPIPGIDVKLGRNPGGQMITNTQTDTNGYYSFTGIPLNLPGEWYTVYVDIPGLGRDSSYSVVLDAANANYDSLNYFVDSTVVYILPPAVTTNITAEELAVANLMSVYPNPSKGNATIEYTINEDAEVSLGVYNVLGVKVASLANGKQMAGKYKYLLNAKDAHLNSGVYFVTLISDGRTSIQRLVITE